MKLGTLEFSATAERPDLLAAPVAAALQALAAGSVGVAEIDPRLSDTESFCRQYQIGMERAANCVVLEAKRGEKSWFAACVILASTRADINGVVRRTLDARKVSFAPMEAAVAQSGMEFGAITPVGLPGEWAVLVDKAVADSESVIIGSGIRQSKLLVPGSFFIQLPNVQIIEGLAQSKT
jgi:prolyl-tRNA editing enzyme YbaK/EbsC (Cys-tRNA(Pro) deacylase)